jgi:FtsH-binding integral membrane protein
MFKDSELKALGLSVLLILFNIALMSVFSFTPLSMILPLAFSVPILGILVYGAMLTGGDWLAEKGIESENMNRALLGVAVLQFAYGTFGAGLLGNLGLNTQVIVLGATAAVTTLIALIAGAVVYGTDRNFSRWQSYSNYCFLGVLGTGFLGTFFTPVLILTFILALLGFIALLVYEIWEMRSGPGKVYLNAVGIYVAFMGVFIQILQLVLELLSRE